MLPYAGPTFQARAAKPVLECGHHLADQRQEYHQKSKNTEWVDLAQQQMVRTSYSEVRYNTWCNVNTSRLPVATMYEGGHYAVSFGDCVFLPYGPRYSSDYSFVQTPVPSVLCR